MSPRSARRFTSIALTSVVMTAMLEVFAGEARAADRHWNVGSGLWNSASSWSPAAVPSPSDHAIIDYFNGAPGLARITATASPLTAVTIANGGTVTVSSMGTLLCGTNFVVGTGSTFGTVNVTTSNPLNPFFGGLTVVTDMLLGDASGVGIVNQNAGTIVVGRNLAIGASTSGGSMFRGTGTYSLSGIGTLRAQTVRVGNTLTIGTFNVGGGRVTADYIYVGGTGQTGLSAQMNQSGGEVNVGTVLMLDAGELSNSLANYNMTGGTLTATLTQINHRSTFNFNGGQVHAGQLRMADGYLNISPGGNKLLRTETQEIFFSSVLDLSDNALTDEGFVSLSSLRFLIGKGYNGGAWNGTGGITSSTARTNPLHNTAIGYIRAFESLPPTGGQYIFRGHVVSGSDGIVAYTYYGDTDLNGIVNFDDYARIDAGFNNGTGDTWFEGDFDYNGIVNFDDYALIDLSFNTQGPPLTSPVPEPATLTGTLAVGIFTLIAARHTRFRT